MLDTQQNFLVQVTRLPKKPEKKTATVVIFTSLLLFMSGDIELNPGPIKTNSFFFLVWARRPPPSASRFSVCHWNLNSLAAHNFKKVALLEAYNTLNKFDLICVSES